MECFIEYQFLRNFWALLIVIGGLSIFTFITLHTFAILRRASNLSKKTRSFHRTMIILLILLVCRSFDKLFWNHLSGRNSHLLHP
ncbi:hypothetical protein PMAYCL1PPCAC_15063, partial [Pristionchus mayeri]